MFTGFGVRPFFSQVVCTGEEFWNPTKEFLHIFVKRDELITEEYLLLPSGFECQFSARRQLDFYQVCLWLVACARQVSAVGTRQGLTRHVGGAIGQHIRFLLHARTRPVATIGAVCIAIPVRIFEHIACAYEVVDGEIILLVEQACASTDDLLKFNDVTDGAHQYDVAHIAGIDASAQFIRCSQNGGQQLLVVLEGSQRSFAHFAIVGGHAFTIVAGWALFVLVHHVANNHGMFLRSTEDDGLLVGVNLLQELFHTMFVALLDLDSSIIEIRLRVNLFGVYFSALHDVSLFILVVIDVACGDVNTEGNQEAILDALFQ